MIRQFLNSLVWLAAFSCWQVQAIDNPRQPIIDLKNQIEQLELRHGPFSAQLIDPVMALAKLHLEGYELESAIDQLHRAQNIAHRNEGVFTPRQFEAVNLLTQIALTEADYRGADTLQKFEFFVQSHHLDPEDPEILFAYAKLADWYMSTGQTRRARRLLKEGIEKADSLGADPMPLAIELSRARRLEGVCCVSKQLLGLLERNPETDPDTLANAYLEIADTYILARKEDMAAEYFLRANETSPLSVSVDPRPISTRNVIRDPRLEQTRVYQVQKDMFDRTRLQRSTRDDILEDLAVEPQWFILDENGTHRGFIVPDRATNGSQNKETQELVGSPILFSQEQLNNVVSIHRQKKQGEIRIEFSFTVTHEGDLEDIEVINSTGPFKLDKLVISALKKAYYRPALADGVPVTMRNVQLVQTFATDYKGM